MEIKNQEIRNRLVAYCKEYHTPLAIIGQLTVGDKHKYLISRFLNGKDLNTETLDSIESFLSEKGF